MACTVNGRIVPGAHSRQRGRRRTSVRGDPCRWPGVGRDHVPDRCGAGGDPPRGADGRSRSRGGHSSHEAQLDAAVDAGAHVRSGPVDKLNDGARCAERRHRVHSRCGDANGDRSSTGSRLPFGQAVSGGTHRRPGIREGSIEPRLPRSQIRSDRRRQSRQPRRLPERCHRSLPAAAPGSASRC